MAQFPTISKRRLTAVLQRGEGDGSLRDKPVGVIRVAIKEERAPNDTELPEEAGEPDEELTLGEGIKLAVKMCWDQASLIEKAILVPLLGFIGVVFLYIVFVLVRRALV